MIKGIDRYAAVVLDIEGTTTSISFVYDELFPYVRDHLADFLADHWDDPGLQGDVFLIAQQAASDVAEGVEGAVPVPAPPAPDDERRRAVEDNVRWQMDQDRKTTGLKALQGRIWVDGYASGKLRGHVFDDVPDALKAWNERNIPVYIYSSGSVDAQKLLFGHSRAGDLTSCLAGHFDTVTGPKKEASSYHAIAGIIDRRPGDILFVTDNPDEARAADAAGFQVALSERPGNPDPGDHGFPVVRELTALV